MPLERCSLEIYVAGVWRVAGMVTVQESERGIFSPASFEYDLDYLDAMADALDARDARAVSCRYPVAYDVPEEGAWPPFLLDIMPAGAARRHWEGTLQLPNNASSDWSVLVRGAGGSWAKRTTAWRIRRRICRRCAIAPASPVRGR